MTKFVNPYNFIPFEEKTPTKAQRESQYCADKELLSGWLDVALYTKTPLIIPDGAYPTYMDTKTKQPVLNPPEKGRKQYHRKYAFLKYDDKYVIPGSELRGMTRSVYEAVTNSCVHALKNDKPISQRIPAASAISRRGLLAKENGRWVLYSAEKEVVKQFKYKNEIENWSQTPGTKMKEGTYLQYNIPVVVSSTQPYTIYSLKKNTIVKRWACGDKTPYNELKSALERDGVTGNQGNPNEKCMKALLEALGKADSGEEQMVPVYYFKVTRGEEALVYMSGSSIGRIGHHRKWADVIGNHKPCEGPDYCPACLLFGSIKKNGLKGRVRFTDAYNKKADLQGEYRTLGILGEPRPSAFEFYYRKPEDDARFWNQDFWSYKDTDGLVKFEDLEKATPRGRKMYWHSEPSKDEGTKMTLMNSTMETLKADAPFKFRVFFDGITQEQLKDLEWVLTLGENKEDSHLQHKLGHAKPLGYGSVKLVIEQVTVRNLSGENGRIHYTIKTYDMQEEVDTGSINKESISVKSVLRMADVNATKQMLVTYPYIVDKKNKPQIYGWFSNNRKNLDKASVLPEPTSESITLEGEWPKPTSSSPKMSGTVYNIWQNRNGKICGKIKANNQLYYFHQTNVLSDATKLEEGMKVSFILGKGEKGPEAKDVRISFRR